MGAPFILLDGLAVLMSLAIAAAIALWSGCEGMVLNWWHVPPLIGLTWMVQHVHGLYPACGMFYSIEFRRVLRTCLMVV